VATGRLREETLAAELEQARAAQRAAEMRCAELEDENHQLRQVTPPAATPAGKRHWMSGGTFFHDR